MREILQIWGGLFYLLNKIFFSRAERSEEKVIERRWQIAAWAVYLAGLPAWVTIFLLERNWVVAAVEAGGAPSMILGMMVAIRGLEKKSESLNWVAITATVIGATYSLYDFGGITNINQIFELGVATGFLLGTYLLANKKSTGYLWFLLMNGSNALLMLNQEYQWLALQQLISFGFVVDAYRTHRRKNHIKEPR